MNKAIKAKLNKIIDYAQNEESGVEQIIVFGEALTEDSESAVIRLAVEFNDELDIEDCFDDMLVEVDEITEGLFELLVINGDNLTSNAIHDIEKGEVIYVSKETTD